MDYAASTTWNSIPLSIRKITCLAIFKRSLKLTLSPSDLYNLLPVKLYILLSSDHICVFVSALVLIVFSAPKYLNIRY